MSYLSSARYGKDKIRLFRVVRTPTEHQVVEYTVRLLVEGQIETSYTKADNSVVVATDSMKNITYALAKTSPHILIPERFALHLGSHVLAKYDHLSSAHIDIQQLKWTRLTGPGGQHSFVRDGDEKRTVHLDLVKRPNELEATMSSGLKDLLVLKSSGSAFEKFVRDEYTTLVEVSDRIFSTAVEMDYTYPVFTIPIVSLADDYFPASTNSDAAPATMWDVRIPQIAKSTTLAVFAEDESASVQATLYIMAQKILEQCPPLKSISYALPNKHYVPVDMDYLGLENKKPANAEVFMPLDAPSGLITATVSRK
ncbi:uricase [Hymenopellis radicata]|nr:uricase [Hymenopellis radicata]